MSQFIPGNQLDYYSRKPNELLIRSKNVFNPIFNNFV